MSKCQKLEVIALLYGRTFQVFFLILINYYCVGIRKVRIP